MSDLRMLGCGAYFVFLFILGIIIWLVQQIGPVGMVIGIVAVVIYLSFFYKAKPENGKTNDNNRVIEVRDK